MVRAPSSVVARPPAICSSAALFDMLGAPSMGDPVDYQALVASETSPDIAQYLRRVDSFLVPGHCKLALVGLL